MRNGRKLSELSNEERESREEYKSWARIAARDAAMQIYHVSERMNKIQTVTKKLQVLDSHVDHEFLTEARNMHPKFFPDFKGIRDAFGHAGTFVFDAASHSNRAANGFIGAGIHAPEAKGLIVNEAFDGRLFHTTVKNRVVGFEISQASLDNLIAIMKMFFRGFEHVAEVIRPMSSQEKLKLREHRSQQR
jgi:hypothetical protein